MQYRCRVKWMDTDYAQVAHYQRFLDWVDDGFQAWCNARGLFFKEQVDQEIGWPLVDVGIQYQSPVTLEDELVVTMVLKDVSPRGTTLDFIISKTDGTVAARGHQKRRFVSQRDLKGSEAAAEALTILIQMQGEEADAELGPSLS